MNITAWIARRYFFSKGKTRFLPFLTLIAIGGVVLGTCAMVVIISVMQGFNKELEKRLLRFNAHITVTKQNDVDITADRLRQVIGSDVVVDVVPFVEGEVIVEAKIGDELFAQGARLRGLDPTALGLMDEVSYRFSNGGSVAEALSRPLTADGLPSIVLGQEMLTSLGVHPDFRDVIEIIAPLADVGPTGELEPRLKRFLLLGSFVSGVYEYDTHFALVSIEQALSVLGAQATEGWQVRVNDPYAVPAMMQQLTDTLSKGFVVEGWHQRNRKLFAALKLERIAMSGVLVLVLLIASFSIIGVIMMVVSSKRKDIALLKTMGMRGRGVRRVFIRQGMWIGIIGSSIGCVIGIGICLVLKMLPIRLPESYYVETLVVYLRPWWIGVVAALGVALSMAAAVYPVWTAVREDPLMALRYE